MVLAIVGLLAAIALPNLDVQRYRVDSAARTLSSTLLGAQRQAVSQHHDVVVSFDLGANNLRVHSDTDNNGEVGSGERVRVVSLGENVVFGSGSAPAHSVGVGPVTFVRRSAAGHPAVTFRRSGSASEAGGAYVTSRRAVNTGTHPEDSRLVTVEHSTGRPSLLRYLHGAWEQQF